MSYQTIRIFSNGKPTYGDRYKRIISNRELNNNEIITIGNEKYIVLFKEEN